MTLMIPLDQYVLMGTGYPPQQNYMEKSNQLYPYMPHKNMHIIYDECLKLPKNVTIDLAILKYACKITGFNYLQ